jgi:hypothetical protein
MWLKQVSALPMALGGRIPFYSQNRLTPKAVSTAARPNRALGRDPPPVGREFIRAAAPGAS